MKPMARIGIHLLAVITVTAIGIGAAFSLFWLDSRQKAVPLHPARVAERLSPAVEGREQSAAARLLRIREHTVAEGDTLSEIAYLYDIDIPTLYAANQGLTDIIQPGDTLLILPQRGLLHRVQAGETPEIIGARYGVPAAGILAVNQKKGNDIIAGEMLFIPRAEAP